MKNLVLMLALVATCVYCYLQTHKEQPPPPAPVAVAVATPKPAPRKLYYHSPLDAPAMPATSHTGTGYYSKNSKSVWKGATTRDGTAPASDTLDEAPSPVGGNH